LQTQIEIVEALLKQEGIIDPEQEIQAFQRQHGGSINDSFLLRTSGAKYFVKISHRKDLKDFFECERRGLELLRNASGLSVPEVIALIKDEDDSIELLVLDFLEEGNPSPDFWKNFGRELAFLHQNSSDYFGLEYNNYIGSLPQSNKKHEDWINFFIHERLDAQYRLARSQNYLDEQFGKDLDRLYGKLDQIIPKEPAALLHGDLWSGNYRVMGSGEAAIFDPAVYYGHREVDLAMMHLFGGFHRSLFDAYHEAYPLTVEWQERIDLFNLYPLLVHVNLFAGSYTSRVKQVLKKYI
jgi:fructosamine-3-kinase